MMEDWVKKAQAGDPEAYERLFRQFGKMAYAAAYEKLRDAQAAEDAVQEAFAGPAGRPADASFFRIFLFWIAYKG